MALKPQPSFDPRSFLAKVGEGRSIGEYNKDQIVFAQGDPADAVFYIQRGKVKVSVVSKQGKEAVVAIHETNDFFGEGCLAGQVRRVATVATMMDSVIARLEKAAIVRVIRDRCAGKGARGAGRLEATGECGKFAQFLMQDRPARCDGAAITGFAEERFCNSACQSCAVAHALCRRQKRLTL